MLKLGKRLCIGTAVAGFLVMAFSYAASMLKAPVYQVVSGTVGGLTLLVGGLLIYLLLDDIEHIRNRKRGKAYRQMLMNNYEK